MGRHADRSPDPRYASPTRIRVETRWGRRAGDLLFVVSLACAAALGALLALVAYAGWTGTEYWREPTELHPVTEPTGAYDGRGYVAPDKVSRIIQQNPHCWIGVPGATCGSERTFIGES